MDLDKPEERKKERFYVHVA